MRSACILVRIVVYALLLAAAPAVASPDGDFDVQVQFVGDEIRADISLFVAAPQQRVWEVLTDYERAPQFTRDLQVSRIVGRSGDVVRLFQKAQFRYGPFVLPVESLKEIRLIAPWRTESRLVSGSMRRHDSTTELIPENGGTRIRVRSVAVPTSSLVTMAGEGVVRRETEDHFRQLRAEILRRAHVASSTP
ncbi:MAG TPA: SRPBCC family protein [Burkholderiales bacterium]|nr:SRPBCC family protein [Burkholderiales bacterium]